MNFKIQNLKLKIFLLVIIFGGIFGLAKNSYATNWYVDNSVPSSGNGQSWATAWKNFSDIVWGIGGVVAGDTLFISGGSISQTYTEQLTVGASGTSGNLITISTGQEAGHNGMVVVDGQSTRQLGVNINGRSYVKLTGQVGESQHMKLTGGTYGGIELGGSLTNIELAYLEVASNGTLADSNGISAAVSFNTNLNIEIHHCLVHDNYQDELHLVQSNAGEATQFSTVRIYDNRIYNISDDGIETALGCDIYDNEFGPRIDTARGHPDQIQFYNSYTKIHDNYFHGAVITSDPGNSNSNIFFDPFAEDITLNPKHVQVYNNLIVEDQLPGVGDVHRGIALKFAEAGVLSANDILVADNTIVGVPFFGITFTLANLGTADVSNIVFENNIFKDIGASGSCVVGYEKGDGTVTYGSHGSGADVIVDYNSIYASSGTYKTDISWGDDIVSLASFKTSSGCDAHGLTGNPMLDANYALMLGSPAKDAGISLPSYFTTDKSGIARPQGGAWDIGAYEYVSGESDITAPGAPGGLSVD